MNKENIIKELKELKDKAYEVPSKNKTDYNIGYVTAINNAITLVQNLNIDLVIKCDCPKNKRYFDICNVLRCRDCEKKVNAC